MSFLEMNLGSDIKEPEVAPEGKYDLIVDKAEVQDNSADKGTVNVRCQLLFDGIPEYSRIFHYISLPTANDDDDKKKFKSLMAKRFLHAFNIPHDENGFDVNDIQGAHGSQIPVTTDEYEGRVNNKLNLPPLSQEG